MFFIIWGSRAIKRKIGEGMFFCPRCGADREYALQKVRRWFTLFFIPLFPMGDELGQQVQCETCKSCFRPEMLKVPTSANLTEYLRNATRVTTVSMVRASDASPAVRAAAVELIRAAGETTYSDEILSSDCDKIDTVVLSAYLTPIADSLSLEGKESFVSKLARVGLAGGPLSAAQVRVLEGVGGWFGLSAAHVKGVIVTASEAAARAVTGVEEPPDSPSM